MTLETSQEECLFCCQNFMGDTHSTMISKALYLKYSSSQNYFHTKDINEFIESAHKQSVVRYKDNVTFEETDDYLIRLYPSDIATQKMDLLLKYYKYQTDIPRYFAIPHQPIFLKFFENKRKLYY